MIERDQTPSSPGPSARGKKDTGKKPPESKTGKPNAKTAKNAAWGKLPPYLRGHFKRNGTPKLPAKYERHRTEFHRRADRKKR